MRTLFTLLFAIGVVTASAQKRKVVEAPSLAKIYERPGNTGIPSADKFVNSVFGLYERVILDRKSGDAKGYGNRTSFLLEYTNEVRKVATSLLGLKNIIYEAKLSPETIKAGRNIIRCKKVISQIPKNLKYMKFKSKQFDDEGELSVETATLKVSKEEKAKIETLKKESEVTKVEGEKAAEIIDNELKRFEVTSTDKAVVYIARPSIAGGLLAFKVFINDELIGKTKGKRFIRVELPAGTHNIRSKGPENKHEISLTVEAGQSYYIRQRSKFGYVAYRTKLQIVDDEEGMFIVEKCKPAKMKE